MSRVHHEKNIATHERHAALTVYNVPRLEIHPPAAQSIRNPYYDRSVVVGRASTNLHLRRHLKPLHAVTASHVSGAARACVSPNSPDAWMVSTPAKIDQSNLLSTIFIIHHHNYWGKQPSFNLPITPTIGLHIYHHGWQNDPNRGVVHRITKQCITVLLFG